MLTLRRGQAGVPGQPEPAHRDGKAVTGRYPIATSTSPQSAYQVMRGLRLSEGYSAIREMAHRSW
jgi:hypothetical protein